VAPLIQLDATASTPDDSARANRVQLLAVDERFWRLASESPAFPSPDSDEVLLNEPLARQLGVGPGATIILRASRPSALSRETPLSPQEDAVLTLRLTVAGLVPEQVLGPFSLQPSQAPRFNAFVPLGALQERLRMPGRANLLVAAGDGLTSARANAALLQSWQLSDVELELRELPGGRSSNCAHPASFSNPPRSRRRLARS
jgi:putative ABC transport system permease protein